MNKVYKLIWNKHLACFVVTAENVKSVGKKNNTVGNVDHVVENMTFNPAGYLGSTLKILVLSIGLCSGMGAWAGTVCETDITSNSTATGNQSFACGLSSKAFGTSSTAVGSSSSVSTIIVKDSVTGVLTVRGIVVTTSDNSSDLDKIDSYVMNGVKITNITQVGNFISAIRSSGNFAGGDNSSAMGAGNTASGLSSSAMGAWNTASGNNSSAMGAWNTASGNNSSAMGYNNQAFGTSSSAMGYNNQASGLSSSAMGLSNRAFGTSSSAMGYNNQASGNYSSAMGLSNRAFGTYSSAMGYNNQALGNYSSAFGYRSIASHANATAIGYQAETDRDNSISVGKVGAEKQITHVANPTLATDAANKNYVDINSLGITSLFGGGTNVTNGIFTAPVYKIQGMDYRNVGTAFSAVDTKLTQLNTRLSDVEAKGIGSNGKSAYEIAQTHGFVGTETEWLVSLKGEQGEQGLQGLTGAKGDKGDQGLSAYEVAKDNGFIGSEADWVTQQSNPFISMNGNGTGNTQSSPHGSIAMGDSAQAIGTQSVAIGQGTVVSGNQSTAVGKGNQVLGDRSGAFGDPNYVSGNASYVVGNDNQVNGDQTFVLGNNVNTEAKNAVVLGHDSASNRDNTVSVGSSSNLRQVIHVAAGIEDTDAVNLAQMHDADVNVLNKANSYTNAQIQTLESSFAQHRLDVDYRFKEMNEQIDRQGAMNAAMMNMASSTAGLRGINRVGVGAGFQGGQRAVAVGYQRLINENTTFSIGGALTDNEKSGGVGVGFGW